MDTARSEANKTAREVSNLAATVKDTLEPTTGEEAAGEIAGDIASGAVEDAYDSEVSEGDDAVSRGIEHGVNPEVNQKDFSNDGDGQRGGPDYGEEKLKKKSTSLKGTDYNDNDLPFESVNPKMTKNQLKEVVLGRKVIKTFKIKDLRDE